MRICLQLTAITAAYAVSGRLGLLLAVPPGYATPVWVPAGVALGALLLWGLRCWPGVFLGSLLLNLQISLDHTPLAAALLTSAGIGTGAALQAVLGAWAIRRSCGTPLALTRERDVLRFMTLSGPVACLVSASVGVGTLLATGAMSAAQAPYSWATWWVGDAIGAVTVTPLLLIAAGRPRDLWRKRALTVGLPLATLFGVLALFFLRTSAWEEEQVRDVFEERTRKVTAEIRTRLRHCSEVTQGIRSFWGASRGVDPDDFSVYTRASLAPDAGIQALEWIPRVPASRRAAFEAAQHDRGNLGYFIWERAPDGRRIPAAPRADYFPIHFVEPLAGNADALGFDLGSEETRRLALENARDSGEASATSSVMLVQQGPGLGLLIAVPIYVGGRTPATPEERRDLLMGFALGVIHLGGLMDAAWNAGAVEGLSLRIREDGAGPGRILWSRGPEPTEPLALRLSLEAPLEVAGRRWTLVWHPSMDALVPGRSRMAWAVLLGGLFFIGLIATQLLVSSGREAAVGGIIAIRTAELSRANDRLAAEVEERTRSENALRESEDRFRSLNSASPMGIFHTDVQGRCLYTNARWQQLSGLSLEESLGEGWATALHPEDRKKVFREWRAATARGQEYQGEFRFLRPSGEIRWISARAAPIFSEEGRLAGYVGTDEDITERRDVERMKDEFISVVSHELRTPITAINGSLGLIAGGATGPISPQGATLVDIAKRNCDRLVRLINDILDMEKIEAGKMPFRMEPLAVDLLIQRNIDALRSIGASMDVRIAFVNDAPGLEIKGDEDRLSQVVVNLVSNAVKFSPRGEAVTVSLRSREDGVKLSVADRGPGIAENFRGRIFEKFLQADSSDTRAKGGTGLGLAISKAIVEIHGGRISFESAPGLGTTFHVDLPGGIEAPTTQNIPVLAAGRGTSKVR